MHTAIRLALGGLYPCPQVVHEVLRPEDGVSKEVLDLGQYDRMLYLRWRFPYPSLTLRLELNMLVAFIC